MYFQSGTSVYLKMTDKQIFSILLTLVSLIQIVSGAKTLRLRKSNTKNCPKITYVQDFNLQEFNGTWYKVLTSQYNSSLENCDRVKLTQKSNGMLSIYRKYINQNGLEVKSLGMCAEVEEGIITFHYPAYPGKILIPFFIRYNL